MWQTVLSKTWTRASGAYCYHWRPGVLDTLHGVAQLVKQLDNVRFVVWLNPFWGPVAEDGVRADEGLSGHQKG
jgi:hypothetical protein